MFGLLAKTSLAAVLGLLFVIAMMIALAVDAMAMSSRRRQQTHRPRNNEELAWS
ncbi:MAG TPA: hypothetical protein VF193_16985 [Steroidobacter sp.]